VPVFAGVMLGGFFRVVLGMQVVSVGHMSMMPTLFVVARFVVLGGFQVMLRGMFMVLGGFAMMISAGL